MKKTLAGENHVGRWPIRYKDEEIQSCSNLLIEVGGNKVGEVPKPPGITLLSDGFDESESLHSSPKF
jgi:hypothetical protein